MSNLIPVNVTVPAHLAAKVGQPSALSQSIAAGISSGQSFPRVSIKGSRFRIIEDGTETVLDTTSLDVIIVGANPKLSKTFYAKAWTPDAEPAAPDCYSLDGVKPHPESETPQNDLCASCPHNAWGSKIGPQGQQLKACTDQKRLAIVAADDADGPIYLLQVTPAALKGLNAYHKELSMRGIPAEIVKTRVSFDTDASFPKLKFGFGGFLEEATYAAVEPLFGRDDVLEITGEKQLDVAPAPTTPRKSAVKVTPEPEPQPQPEPDTKAKRGFGAVAPEKAETKRGFGAAKTEEPKAATRSKPKPAVVADDDVSSLADEIAALVGDDDE